MPQRSQRRKGPGTFCRQDQRVRALAQAHAHQHVLDAADEVRAQPFDRPDELYIREPRKKLFERDPHLEPGEPGAETEMVTDAESDVLVRIAADVEALRLGERLVVVVRRNVPENDFVAGSDGDSESRVAVRRKCIVTVDQRRISSVAFSVSSGCSVSSCSWSRCSIRAKSPCEIVGRDIRRGIRHLALTYKESFVASLHRAHPVESAHASAARPPRNHR